MFCSVAMSARETRQQGGLEKNKIICLLLVIYKKYVHTYV